MAEFLIGVLRCSVLDSGIDCANASALDSANASAIDVLPASSLSCESWLESWLDVLQDSLCESLTIVVPLDPEFSISHGGLDGAPIHTKQCISTRWRWFRNIASQRHTITPARIRLAGLMGVRLLWPSRWVADDGEP
ncbi:MAG: hypothetical protein FJ050_02675 [Cyanobacteria bacterium M_surface_7_m2_040]|nr:hypothetical protein [Cyanobacteria bacterium M_surface_7_m2_040]